MVGSETGPYCDPGSDLESLLAGSLLGSLQGSDQHPAVGPDHPDPESRSGTRRIWDRSWDRSRTGSRTGSRIRSRIDGTGRLGDEGFKDNVDEISRLNAQAQEYWVHGMVDQILCTMYKEAEEVFMRLASTAAKDPRSYFNVGLAKHAQGDMLGAISWIEKALKLPGSDEHHRFQLSLLLSKLNRLESLKNLKTLLTVEPRHVPSLLEFGRLLQTCGQSLKRLRPFRRREAWQELFFLEAQALFKRAISMQPDSPVALLEYCISCTQSKTSEDEVRRIVQRVTEPESIERVVALEQLSDFNAAQAINQQGVHVLLQGYAGTSGASYMHYNILDKVQAPPEHAEFYSERLQLLPVSAFKGEGSSEEEVMTEALPAERNLKNFAKEFKNFLEQERIKGKRVADLFLDTPEYNAHGTATEVLSSGVPVLTLPGSKAHSSRVAASVVIAAGLPEIIARDLEDYEEIATKLISRRVFDVFRVPLVAGVLVSLLTWIAEIAWELFAQEMAALHTVAAG
ncbi:hypothetical protein GUITHDRAFT_135331 [Guillardia theta CCMP2712]|uniref:O-GlcNAc transferase C-terminal domain-containing protein n=1 Tax=Guillardia theta (strain CCMP2712) TaxID=905079 RepID=L1JNW2_GUITC|nr:hypothetical protein GUITHDRAFT_135331 [Guillardia theta CCMP2712]EKX50147.1 hypothetical protein GUITHDRAFT_135331 [Guillardia theta CCMP2712]|eukprot:XP_005837127.1 hypothetical protein GUITHDRAFT_135331 [Guillardia theta CCMP2712]